jgi:hypothetical protein
MQNRGFEHHLPSSLDNRVLVGPAAWLPLHSTQNCSYKGKGFWVYYAAHHRLAEKKTFLWFYQANYYLFVKEGVYRLPSDWEHTDFLCIMWTLVDSDQSRVSVPEILVPHGTQLFVIYITSLAEERWSRMDKTTNPTVVIMNPWSRKEIN